MTGHHAAGRRSTASLRMIACWVAYVREITADLNALVAEHQKGR